MSNRLKDEKSPYLLQHKDNPVDWYPWCDEAFRKAETEDKPIFLSIGYSTCHWCHVMAHESFEDGAVAELLNQGFVCIKVDREEQPDIDAVYMSACQAVTGQGGWPLTIIMTSEQKPFFAGTYFPKERYYGRPGLVDILKEVLLLWQDRREDLLKDGEEITVLISNQCTLREKHSNNRLSEKEIFHKAYHIFVKQFDPVWGGFGGAPKFPSPHNLLFLMRFAKEEKEPEALRMAEITLNAMADGGIHDHIGGGFSRYSTDEQWLVPHFEKMLYDNALMLLAYVEAYQITEKEKYRDVAVHTADYILRELKDWQGGFYCGQDADSEGVEGKYYVFTQDEVASVLGEADGKEFCRQYGITKEGNFEGRSIPNRLHNEQTNEAFKEIENDKVREKQAAVQANLDKLYQYRLNRTSLHKDDKILLSWNAWTILALARAGVALRESRYLEAAKRAQEFIEGHMSKKGGRLYRCFCDGEAAHQGMLEDYAVYALALLELYRVDFRVEYLANAIYRAKQMLQFFEDAKEGGYFINASDAVQLISRPKEMYDGAIPSGNSVAAMALQRLSAMTGEAGWQEAARRQMEYCARQVQEYPAGYSFALLAMAEAVYPHRELVCAVNGEVSEKLRQQLVNLSMQGVDVLIKTEKNAEALTKCAPFTSDYPLPQEGVMYYLCENGACQAPVRELAEHAAIPAASR